MVSDHEAGPARIRDRLPATEIEIYPEVGHDLLWADPEQVVPRFLDFVERHDRS